MKQVLLSILVFALSLSCFAKLSPLAKSTISSLQKGEELSFTIKINGSLPSVPNSIREYLSNVVSQGKNQASSLFFSEKLIAVPPQLQPFISGSQDYSRFILDPEAEKFFKSVFEHIQQNSLMTPVKLTGWDLFHGHAFAITAEDLAHPIDLAILFHAKEYPQDYPFFGKKTKDPRIGSQCHTSDHDYHFRNYLWLLSTNQVILLDPRAEAFPKAWLEPNPKFFTVDEEFFSSLNLFDLNYFPWFNEEKIYAWPI